MKYRSFMLLSAFAAGIVVAAIGMSHGSAPVLQQETEKTASPDLEGVKCPMMGEKAGASAEHGVEYKGGTVYFCCGDCAEAFSKDPSAHSMEANHQLVVTGQFKQTACPISGDSAMADGQVSTIAGVEIGFCCENCKGKFDSEADNEAKVKMVFADAVFDKSFSSKKVEITTEGIKCFLMPKKDIKEDKFVEYNDGKVFVCCDGCVKRFSKDPAKFATKANQQLVQTGQFEQTGCPISGGKVDPEQTVEVNGVKVGFCCGNCKGKVEGASDEEKAEMVFGSDAFAKGFTKR